MFCDAVKAWLTPIIIVKNKVETPSHDEFNFVDYIMDVVETVSLKSK